MGWALIAVPAFAGFAQLVLPWRLAGTLLGTAGLIASLVLIGIDAEHWKRAGRGHVTRALLLWAVYFPLYVRRRSLWGAPNRLPYAVLVVVLFLVGSFYRPFAIQDRAKVRCAFAGKTLGEGFDCAIERTAGPHSIEACWDLVLTCANGPGGTGHACGTAPAGGSAQVAIPYSALTGAQGCDRITNTELQNLIVRVE